MVRPREKSELDLMRKSGEISRAALEKVVKAIKVGVTGEELDKLVEDEIIAKGGEISFRTVEGYKWATCITFNEQVVHGIPTKRVVEPGDIVSVDLGTVYKGWHTDTAWSVLVPSRDLDEHKKKDRFLKIGEEALWLGIAQAVEGNTVGHISEAIQKKVEGSGYSIVRSLVGHGVGKELHEEPEVPGYGKSGQGLVLQEGMTLAIEVIYTAGKSGVVVEDDNWTISSEDGSWGGLFEMTVIVGKKRAEVLTNWRKTS